MTAALLENDRIKDRRNQFRRDQSRREFLNPLTDCGLPLASCGLLEAPPIVEPPLAAPPAPEPVEPIADTDPKPESAIPNPQPAIDPAAELLSDPRVRRALGGKVPSRRNREIFRAVVVAKRSQRDVAAEHGITQPRVSQIVQQVATWLSENLVEQDRPRSGLAQIQIAENLVRMQYDHLYATALDLLHGRGNGAPADADGQDTQPHKPNAAFLNTALRVVNSRAKFEGVNGRAARRAMDEAEQRGVSMFGPTNDNLEPDDGGMGPQPDENADSTPSYNPLSRDPADMLRGVWSADEISEGFREAYEQKREWFPGDFTARAAYYQTQIERAFGPDPEDEDPAELECSHIELIHQWDLMAAEAHETACEQAAGEPGEWPAERLAALRRQLLIEILKRERSVKVDSDAEGLLRCLEYDDASGRFGWDLRFGALRADSSDRSENPPAEVTTRG